MRKVNWVFFAVSLMNLVSAHADGRLDAGAISGLPARNIGSAQMSGRISAIAGVKDKGAITLYVGAASGGVWKSVNGGLTFTPVFDRQNVQSIGAIAIDPSHPTTLWVGTGESWTRNSVSIGNGLFKSTDGGETWLPAGLENSERIAKIIVDPKNGDTVYACATGHLWNDHEERGVYKTTDGGAHWLKILAGVNGSTGCGLLSMSSKSASTLYASLWDFRRQAWTFRSGGPGSGLFKTTDGGAHWTELTAEKNKGFPEKPFGRIAVAVAPSKPSVVYATIESKSGAIYRSDDEGATWQRLDASQNMVWRPFYFSNLIVDPTDENRVFKPDGPLLLSVNGGKSFSVVSGSAHGDFHDLWIDPANAKHVFAGDDGGLWQSPDGGQMWQHFLNLPVSQFYHVSVDNANPYHVYGGLQDNSSWVGDSSYPGGITNQRWENLYGGDGFWTWEDPSDTEYIYAEAQGGEISRINRHTLSWRSIKPFARFGEKKLRFNWNAPIQMSPNEKGTIYLGSQYLYRSRNHGQSWQRISPDLTTNNPDKQKQEESGGVTIDNSSAEMNTTIYSISESPKNGKVIWVGTDDGNVQLTRDGAKSWTNLSSRLPGPAAGRWISWIEASRFNPSVAFAAVDYHTAGDPDPHVYKTVDFGKTWQSLPLIESGVRGYAHVIKEDLVNQGLLFLGTEFGLWISVDGGQHWAQYKGSNFPAVAVRDLAMQKRESDLVIATHGRGIWILDDISPLRQLNSKLIEKEAEMLPNPPAIQYMNTSGGWSEGDAVFTGPNRAEGATIAYFQKTRHIFGDIKIEIFDAKGKLVGTVPAGKHRGLNRAFWSMTLKPPHVPPAASAMFEAARGPRVPPGEYTVKMTKNEKVYTSKFKVVLDPRAKYTVADRLKQFQLANRIAELLNHMSWAVDAIIIVRDQANAAAGKINAGDALAGQLQKFAAELDVLRSQLVATKEGGAITGEERLREFAGQLYGAVNSYEGRPTDDAVERTSTLERELGAVIQSFTKLTQVNFQALNPGLSQLKLEALKSISESEWRAQHAGEESGGESSKNWRSRFEHEGSDREEKEYERGERD